MEEGKSQEGREADGLETQSKRIHIKGFCVRRKDMKNPSAKDFLRKTDVLRWVVSIGFIYLVSTESGPFTTLAIALMLIAAEIEVVLGNHIGYYERGGQIK
jgi:hypothetical protein